MMPHEFDEDVADGSMCMCGIPALTHDMVMAQHHGPLSRDLSDPGLVDHPAPERAAQPVLANRRNELVTADEDDLVAEAIGWASLTQQQRDEIIYDRAAAAGCSYCGSTNCSGRCPERTQE